jgi:hypothetical protein
MADAQRYSNILVYREGTLLTEENEVTVTRDFANKGVVTVAKGLSGYVKGAPVMKVSIRNAVPAKGVEYDPGPDGASATPKEYTFVRGSQSLTNKFVVMSDDTGHKAGDESHLNFDLEGPVAQWQQL